jgi:serine protease
VPAAWARGFRGQGTVIAVLDSGIDQTHPDLLPNLLPGADLLAIGGEDCPPGPEDDDGHGTHTAGIAAAAANNGIGVAGVAPEANILPLKAGDQNDAPVEAMIDGIRYAADHGADVVSISLARGESLAPPGTQVGPLEPQIEAAVEYAWSRGTVVVGAAGNASRPLCSYPAGAARSICVTASDRMGRPTSYSNVGAEADGTVVVRAPGGGGTPGTVDLCADNVVSTMWPRADYDGCLRPRGIRGYENLAGTSMATPHVAGLVALLAGAGLSAPEIVERISTTTASPFTIVDADAATEGLPVPAPAPPAPTAAERRCRQARATLRLRIRALRRARQALRRRHSRRNQQRVRRRAAARRVAARDVRRRCA